jgi:Tol biopolymer transport system component
MGRLAFVQDGAIWAMNLPAGHPERLTTGSHDGTPRWSPSGDWLAYTVDQNRLWVVRSDGSGAREILSCPGWAGTWGWSPAADRLACIDRAGGLQAEDADGSHYQVLVMAPGTTSGSELRSVAWRPDGKALAFARMDGLEPGGVRKSSLWRIDADGRGARELTNAGSPSRDALIVAGWSADGSHVLYRINEYFSGSLLADGTTLWAVPAGGGTPVQLGQNLTSAAKPSKDRVLYHADFLAWPDARGEAAGQLAVTFGGYRGSWTNKRVGLVDAGTGQARLLSPADLAATSASWSPDNRFLAYSAMPDTGDLVGGATSQRAMMARRIYVVNAQGDPQPRQLTDDPAYRDELPLWSADGQQILYARLDRQSRASLWLMPATGGEARQVVDDLPLVPDTTWFGDYGHIDWQTVFDWWQGPAPR